MMLKVENLNVYYGSIHAIKDLSFEVNEGEIVSLIGANGAGKTTTLHSIQGLLKAASGNVTFMDKNINGSYAPMPWNEKQREKQENLWEKCLKSIGLNCVKVTK